MGFVREGNYPDVFVSYAHVDDQGEAPWVSNLVRHLQDQLCQLLGNKAVQFWRDYDALDHNHPFPPKILEAVQRSATVLVVMSEGYLASEWCAQERNAFLNVSRSFVADGRFFIVHCRETDRKARPPEFGGLDGYKFWTEEPNARGAKRPLGWPDFKERDYWTAILNLSDELARELREIKARGEGGPPGTRDCVFLARSTDDLEEREDELRSYLTQAGLGILPETWYPEEDTTAFRSAMEADLARCSVFVQLLSKVAGRRVGGAGGRRYPAIQHDTARDKKKPILQWRYPAEDPATVGDPDHLVLLEGARTCGFEEFKRAVVEAARRKPSPPPYTVPPGTVFVNAERDDFGVARELSTLLAKQGLDCFLPMLEGNPEKVRQDLEASLKACDGLVLVYGAADPFWVRDQLRQGRKILSQREQALLAQALYLGPPPEKAELGAVLPEVIMLDGRQGLKPDIVHQFIKRLTPATVEG
jgi:hypothetical protein